MEGREVSNHHALEGGNRQGYADESNIAVFKNG